MLNDRRPRELVYYESAAGAAVLEREIGSAKLSKSEAVRLDELLDRAEGGELRDKDAKHLRGDIWELRLQGDRRIFRLLFATTSAGTVILGVRFFKKTTQKTPPGELDKADARLAEYRRSHRERSGR